METGNEDAIDAAMSVGEEAASLAGEPGPERLVLHDNESPPSSPAKNSGGSSGPSPKGGVPPSPLGLAGKKGGAKTAAMGTDEFWGLASASNAELRRELEEVHKVPDKKLLALMDEDNMRRALLEQVSHGLQLQSLWIIPTAAVS